MPLPLSVTRTSRPPPSVRVQAMSTLPPSGTASRALPMMLRKTCCSWPRSDTMSGRPSAKSVPMFTPRFLAPRSRKPMVSVSTSGTLSSWRLASMRRAKPSRRWVMPRARSTVLSMASSRLMSRSLRSKSPLMCSRSRPRPAFSLMTARGLLTSWATPAASRPMEESFWLCSIWAKTATRRSSLACRRPTRCFISRCETRTMTAMPPQKTSSSSLRRAVQGL